MNLGDVLRGLGDAPLKDHAWTQAIVTTLNATLPSGTPLTPDSTGREVLAALVMLPEAERDRMLSSTVDLVAGTLTLATASDGGAATDAKSESFHSVVLKDLVKDPPKTLALILGGLMVLCAMVLTVIMTTSYAKTGKAPDSSLFVTLIRAMIDIFTAVNH